MGQVWKGSNILHLVQKVTDPMRHLLLIIATALTALASTIVWAQDNRLTDKRVVGDATGPMMKGWLEARGLRAKLSANRRGDPRIVFRLNRVRVILVFFACRGVDVRRCKGIQFSTGYRMRRAQQLGLINRWNQTKRYARAFRHRTRLNSVRLEQDLSFAGGMTRRIFYAHLTLYQRLNRAFRAHIGFRVRSTNPSRPRKPGTSRKNEIRDL
jgi:hypothetical protein